MITEFFGDLIIRKEDIISSQTVLPGDVLNLRFEKPCFVVVVSADNDSDENTF